MQYKYACLLLFYCLVCQVKIDELIAVCEVAGMIEPVLLSINADVEGLTIEYDTPDVIGNQVRYALFNFPARIYISTQGKSSPGIVDRNFSTQTPLLDSTGKVIALAYIYL